MDLYKDLLNENKWNEFLESKIKSNFLSKKEIKELSIFINEKQYLPICNLIVSGKYNFSIPKKVTINKLGNSKKRTVYMFNDDEVIILKYINYLLYDYDSIFSSNLYSFRKSKSVKDAITRIKNMYNLNNMYAYKVDISNYFNSVPISSFLANYYLKDMDLYFEKKNILYFRYADDIIVFSNSLDKLNEYKNIIIKYLLDSGLNINFNKEYIFKPKENIDFLGFEINGKIIDISKIQLKKIKDKIRRRAKSFRRWKINKSVDDNVVLSCMNKKFNRKFYGKDSDELSWKYYFFPLISTTKSLHEIDLYMQQWQRYVMTGVHNKKNYEKVTYDFLKSCGYKSLVHEYYEFDDES